VKKLTSKLKLAKNEGIVPVNELFPIFNKLRFISFEKDAGIVPLNPGPDIGSVTSIHSIQLLPLLLLLFLLLLLHGQLMQQREQ